MTLRSGRSLAAKMALLFSAITAVVFGIACWHLYHSLDQQLQRRDDLVLLGTVEMMRRELAHSDGVDGVHRVVNLLNAAYGPSGIAIGLRDRDGRVLAASAPEMERWPMDAAVPIDRTARPTDVRDWDDGHGRRGRLVVALGRMGNGPGEPAAVAVIEDRTRTGLMLDSHAREVLWTLAGGVLAIAVAGFIAARRALAPVREVARTAERITASQLGERLRVEDAPPEMQDMVKAFNRMLDRLEESFKRLTRYSSDLAHDLRTPLSNLMVGSQVALAKERPAAEYQTLLASNMEEFERLSRMIADMLFIAKADNPQTVIESARVELRDELDKVIEYYAALAEEKHVSIVCRGAAAVTGDRLLLQRAMQNLLSNAIRYADPDSRIDIGIAPGGAGQVTLTVTNRGPGIAGGDLPHVFDRFYRADGARQNSSEGSGLGLAIVKSIAALHRGTVSVASVPGGDTTFALRLPAG